MYKVLSLLELFGYLLFFWNYQEAKRRKVWLQSPWAIVALAFLGFNGIRTLLRYFTFAVLLRCPICLSLLLLLDTCLFFGGEGAARSKGKRVARSVRVRVVVLLLPCLQREKEEDM